MDLSRGLGDVYKRQFCKGSSNLEFKLDRGSNFHKFSQSNDILQTLELAHNVRLSTWQRIAIVSMTDGSLNYKSVLN
jgi:hypothetical protein